MGKYLRKNHSTASPGSIVFVDCETAPSGEPVYEKRKLHKLLMGHATYVRLDGGEETRRKEITFTTTDEFWLWLLNVSQMGRPTWVFAHNIGFDLTVLEFWETLNSGEWRIRDDDVPAELAKREAKGKKAWRGFYVDGDPPTIISCKHKSGLRALFVDTMNYWPVTLKKLGKNIGLPKLEMPPAGSDDKSWTEYCRRDVAIIEKAILGLIRWVKDNEYGMFRFTASAQAMAAFRHRFHEKRIDLERPDQVKQLERASYFGGRLEMLYEGQYEGQVWELDVQGMYAATMAEEYVPRELVASWLDGDAFKPPPVGPGRFSVAEVLIESTTDTYPMRMANCTLYPHGRYWTVLCGRELENAFQRGHVSCVGRWATYQLAQLFSEYVRHFWEKRQKAIDEGDELGQELCKMFPNSLYGKFAQLSPQWEACGSNLDGPRWGRFPDFDCPTQKLTVCRHIGLHTERMIGKADHSMSFTAASSWVTAAARERMRQLVKIAGDRNCLYVVYDAVFVTQKGFANLWAAGEIKPGQLGKLAVKGYEQKAEFRGFNNYTMGDKRVIAGIKPDAIPIGNSTYQQIEMQGIAEIISSKPLAGVMVGMQEVTSPGVQNRWERDDTPWTIPLLVSAAKPSNLAAIRSGDLPRFE
jgi:hypothetical protein